ncbi:hypothetical protein LRR81_16780 [Metabacillus sp. GX 13764]|uniref:esterase/lipase family protein n=1 Tax=Metabacillus kandeliae TaxID=2900151 RepID=UPI001E4123C2|nr:hypothetical protein [Metabacillus kandeliae]MCD7035901.1 hypothetical protein [Metabacillus kandeliae]
MKHVWQLVRAVLHLLLGGKKKRKPGTWLEGKPPIKREQEKKPIVFVHGFHESADDWLKENNIEQLLSENGFRSAFAELFPDKDNWVNGEVLARQLKEIAGHFKSKVIVVAHSKGGIDAETAILYHGAEKYTDRIIALAAPFYGSQLADLAFSGWADWLAELLQFRNGAVFSLQTSNMAYFRKEAAGKAARYEVITLSGNSWGTFGTPLYWGGMYLSHYGENDGAVLVKSTRHPAGRERASGNWDHYTIIRGEETFRCYEPDLEEGRAVPAASDHSHPAAAGAPHYFEGGRYNGRKAVTIDVEPGVNVIGFDWMSSTEAEVLATSPSGQTFPFIKAKDSSFFTGAVHHYASIPEPEHGSWTIEAKSTEPDSYLLNASFDSPLNKSITPMPFPAHKKLSLEAAASRVPGDAAVKMNIKHYRDGREVKREDLTAVKQEHAFEEEGHYVVGIEVKGKTSEGARYQRSTLKSFYVDDSGSVYES